MIYKHLEEKFFPILRRKVVTLKPQRQTKSAQPKDPIFQSQELKVDNQLHGKIIRLHIILPSPR